MTENKYPPLPDFEEVAQHVYWVSRGYIPRGMLEPIHDLMRAYVDADRAMRTAPASQDALVRERDAMRETLEMIVAADWRKWEELAQPEEFVRWAKARAAHALQAVTRST